MHGPTGWEPPAAGSPDDGGEGWRAEGFSTAEELTLDAGPRPLAFVVRRWSRLPSAVRLGAATLACAAAVVGLLLHSTSPAPHTQARHSAPPAHSAIRPSPPLILAKALSAAPLADYTRSTAQPGECAIVPPSASPTRALTAAVRRALPGFRVRDVSRTLDQSTGLCAVDVRIRDANGSVAIVEVVSPGRPVERPFDVVNIEVTSDGTTASSIASTLTREGWSVTVAVVGPIADQPSSSTMLALAGDRSLTW